MFANYIFNLFVGLAESEFLTEHSFATAKQEDIERNNEYNVEYDRGQAEREHGHHDVVVGARAHGRRTRILAHDVAADHGQAD